MNQIHFSFLGNSESVGELGEDERGQLHESHGSLLDVFQYPGTVTQPLKFQRVEIGEARDPGSAPSFMTLCTRMVGGKNLQFHAEPFKLSPQMIDKYPC